MALVHRGVPRMLVFACPDGCGDVLPVNLDDRADKAWRFYQREGANTLYPSVWRDEGCQAHFILWNDVIYWNGFDRHEADPALEAAVLSELDPTTFKSYFDVALALDEVPWSVLVACERLVRGGLAVQAPGKGKGRFKRKETSATDTPTIPVPDILNAEMNDYPSSARHASSWLRRIFGRKRD